MRAIKQYKACRCHPGLGSLSTSLLLPFIFCLSCSPAHSLLLVTVVVIKAMPSCRVWTCLVALALVVVSCAAIDETVGEFDSETTHTCSGRLTVFPRFEQYVSSASRFSQPPTCELTGTYGMA
jgi:hypothetical protein